MSESMITAIGAIAGVAAIGVVIAAAVFFWKMAPKAQASTVAAHEQAAAAHGWQFTHHRELGKLERTWSGTTDGVSWAATHTAIGGDSSDREYRRHTFRWRAGTAVGAGAPLLLIPERSSLTGVDKKTEALPGFIRGVAAKAIDHIPSVYFGPGAADVDLSTWAAVEGHGLATVRVLAPVADAAAALLTARLAPVLMRQSAALSQEGEPPAVLVRQDAVHLATRSDTTAADVERAVAIGVAVVNALR